MKKYIYNNPINIQVGKHKLIGKLIIPEHASSLIIFSHGGISERFENKNNYVARLLTEKGLAVLLIDLLTEEEDKNYYNKINIMLLSQRLTTVTNYLLVLNICSKLNLAYYGVGRGAAAALKASVAFHPGIIKAIVLRNGNTDMAYSVIPKVMAPSYLIVNQMEDNLIKVNFETFKRLNTQKKMDIVKGDLGQIKTFGSITDISMLAAGWFTNQIKSEVEIDYH